MMSGTGNANLYIIDLLINKMIPLMIPFLSIVGTAGYKPASKISERKVEADIFCGYIGQPNLILAGWTSTIIVLGFMPLEINSQANSGTINTQLGK
ncbi:MAG: hypothetical protein GY742_17925 [Hyphomicrobiales bacterium]|nr:hypothetical protein [Hyphomicrobiales bacterium]